MRRSYTSKCSDTAQIEHIKFHGVSERENHADDLQQASRAQSKWDKSFWARGYYISTIGNITEDAIKKYIQE